MTLNHNNATDQLRTDERGVKTSLFHKASSGSANQEHSSYHDIITHLRSKVPLLIEERERDYDHVEFYVCSHPYAGDAERTASFHL